MLSDNRHFRELLHETRLNATLVLLVGLMIAAAVLMWGVSLTQANDVPTSAIITICGDGLVGVGEVCDAGRPFNIGGYASSTTLRTCEPGCETFGPYCGDHTLQVRFGEQCDDGNNTSGDLCDATCATEPPPPPTGGAGGSPSVGSTPFVPGASPGSIPSERQTKVVLRGKAYANSTVNILLDGKAVGTVTADSNADFLFTTTAITPGTATFSFWSRDAAGVDSITTSMVFEVVQSAVTTLANIYLPPTIAASSKQIKPGGLVTLSGYTVPSAKVSSPIIPGDKSALSSTADGSGKWALQVDTASLSNGFHSVKSMFQLPDGSKSGYGRSLSFFVGEGEPPAGKSPDLNLDGKVNLIDFSIFLTSWGTDNDRSDFNSDTKVNLADFSIMLFAWTG